MYRAGVKAGGQGRNALSGVCSQWGVLMETLDSKLGCDMGATEKRNYSVKSHAPYPKGMQGSESKVNSWSRNTKTRGERGYTVGWKNLGAA